MIIDAHAHACGEYLDLQSIIKVLDENKTDQVVLCPGEANSKKSYGLPLISEWFPQKDIMFGVNRVIGFITKWTGAAKHMDQQNQYVFQLAQMAPERIIQAYWINPLEWGCIKKLESDYRAYQFKLIKMHQCWHSFDLDDHVVEEILEWALACHMPIFIHLSDRKQVMAFIERANRHLDNTFIVAHLIGFEEIIAHSKNPNVYYEISPPPLIDVERLKRAIHLAGPDKIIMGSDTPYGKQNLKMNLNRIKELDLSEYDKNLIRGENMRRILYLKSCDQQRAKENV